MSKTNSNIIINTNIDSDLSVSIEQEEEEDDNLLLNNDLFDCENSDEEISPSTIQATPRQKLLEAQNLDNQISLNNILEDKLVVEDISCYPTNTILDEENITNTLSELDIAIQKTRNWKINQNKLKSEYEANYAESMDSVNDNNEEKDCINEGPETNDDNDYIQVINNYANKSMKTLPIPPIDCEGINQAKILQNEENIKSIQNMINSGCDHQDLDEHDLNIDKSSVELMFKEAEMQVFHISYFYII